MKLAPIVLVIALVPAACGSGEPQITARALPRIMPSAADAPAGTAIRTDLTGPKTLDEFVTAEDVKARLRALGFKVAYTATFASASFPADPTKAPSGSALYASSAILLRDVEAARSGFTFYESRLRRRAKNLTPILAEDLGAESFAFHFSSLEDSPLPGVAFLFRVGNALFSVVGIGNPDPAPDVARAAAELMAVRAEKT